MDQYGDKQHPPGLKDQEELNSNDRVDHEERICDACKHLWASECDKERASLKFL